MAAAHHRIVNIDRLRILAAFGVIWLHTEKANAKIIAWSALPVFLMLFCALISNNLQDQNLKTFSQKKIHRLLIPWLFWSLIYLAAKISKRIVYNISFSDVFTYYTLFTGPRIHLWFLPYAFIMAFAIYQIYIWTVNISPVTFMKFLILLAVTILFLCSFILSTTPVPVPFSQWLFGLPAVFLGFAIGRISALTDTKKQKFYILTTLAASETICLLLVILKFNTLVIPYGIAILLVCAAFIYKGRFDPVTSKVSSLTYGIYLIHPLIFSIIKSLGSNNINDWLLMSLVFIFSAAVSSVLKKTALKIFI